MKRQSHPSRRLLLGFLCMGIGILILVIKLAGGEESSSSLTPFYISGSGESTTTKALDTITVSFGMELSNSGKSKKMIHSIEPVLSADAEIALLDKTRPIFVIQQYLYKEDIKIRGEIDIDLNKLSDDIGKNMPFIEFYKVIYDDDQTEYLKTAPGLNGGQ